MTDFRHKHSSFLLNGLNYKKILEGLVWIGWWLSEDGEFRGFELWNTPSGEYPDEQNRWHIAEPTIADCWHKMEELMYQKKSDQRGLT